MKQPAADPWADTALRGRHRLPARRQLRRALPGLLSFGLRVAVASTLPTLTELVCEVAAPDL